jgi:hypothetical protein
MFSILSHKINASQNIIEIPTHPSQNGKHLENKQQTLKRMGLRTGVGDPYGWHECKLVQPL